MATRRAQPVLENEDAPAETPAKRKRAPKGTPVPAAVNGSDDAKRARRVMGDRNWLAREIDKVLRDASGPVTVREIVNGITNKHGEHPSSGAVAAAIKRWAEQGYINTNGGKPLAFKSFAGKNKSGTLDGFLDRQREVRLAERRAAKA